MSGPVTCRAPVGWRVDGVRAHVSLPHGPHTANPLSPPWRRRLCLLTSRRPHAAASFSRPAGSVAASFSRRAGSPPSASPPCRPARPARRGRVHPPRRLPPPPSSPSAAAATILRVRAATYDDAVKEATREGGVAGVVNPCRRNGVCACLRGFAPRSPEASGVNCVGEDGRAPRRSSPTQRPPFFLGRAVVKCFFNLGRTLREEPQVARFFLHSIGRPRGCQDLRWPEERGNSWKQHVHVISLSL